VNAPPPAPAWLADLQRQFGDALRAPLRVDAGALRPDPASYPPSLCARASTRLAVYNRQYWFRLYGALQGEYPLTARLLGLWTFNQAAQAFLLAHPPRHADLRRAADGFADAITAALTIDASPAHGAVPASPAPPPPAPPIAPLATAITAPPAPSRSSLPAAALAQAARLDEAWREIWAAPEQPGWRPGPADLTRFERLRLRRSLAATIVCEEWPLLELRHALADDAGEGAVPLPPAHPGPRRWALCRVEGGVLRWPLEPAQARLLELLAANPVGQALGALEAEAPEGERARLAEQVREWLAQSVRAGFWATANETGPPGGVIPTHEAPP
jgi:Putative DNA-binding domain